jgi:hypothetical protein
MKPAEQDGKAELTRPCDPEDINKHRSLKFLFEVT